MAGMAGFVRVVDSAEARASRAPVTGLAVAALPNGTPSFGCKYAPALPGGVFPLESDECGFGDEVVATVAIVGGDGRELGETDRRGCSGVLAPSGGGDGGTNVGKTVGRAMLCPSGFAALGCTASVVLLSASSLGVPPFMLGVTSLGVPPFMP